MHGPPIRARKSFPSLLPILVALAALSGGPAPSQPAPGAYHVAPGGNDADPGTRSRPFASLEAARDAIRARRRGGALPEGGVTVHVRGGLYPRRATFALGPEDSGTSERPIVYRSEGGESPRLSGGVRLDPSRFRPVADSGVRARLLPEARAVVVAIDLRAQGITDFGKLDQHGFSLPIQAAPLDLFLDGRPMTLARWPNQGTVPVGRVLDPGSKPRDGDFSNRGGRFTFDFDRAARWAGAEEIWLDGIFSYGYADDNLRVAGIDLAAREIRVAQPHIYGLMPSDEKTPAGRLRGYYAYNLLEELDAPGEYFVDRKSGTLYFWPPGGLGGRDVTVSVLAEPLVALEGASNVVLDGLTFEHARGMGIYLQDGDRNTIRNCTFRNLGTVAVCMGQGVDGPEGPVHEFSGRPVARRLGNLAAQSYENAAWNRRAGTNHVIEGCLIHDTGTGGIILDGGDRPSLVPGNNTVRGSEIHHYNRWNKTYCPAISLRGVGNRVTRNFIHDAPHQAIALFGNDHVVERNRIERVCLNADDMGAIYNGRNPSERGNVIRHNLLRDLEHASRRITGIYFDDGACGGRVYGNVFHRVGDALMGAIFVHGGHDHAFENNVFVECRRALGNTPWNDARWREYALGALWRKRLREDVDVTRPPYTTRYPELRALLDPAPGPRVNRAARNLAYRCGVFAPPHYALDANWVTDQDPGFADAGRGDLRLRPDAPVFREIPGFEAIPLAEVGPALPAGGALAAAGAGTSPSPPRVLDYAIQLDTISRGFDGITCWVHPRAGTIPGERPIVVLTMQKLLLAASDVFFALNEMRTDDLGATWVGPTEHATLGRRREPSGGEVGVADFTPAWHARSRTMLGIGVMTHYAGERKSEEAPARTAYSAYDAGRRAWMPWKVLDLPDRKEFHVAAAGCVQRVDLPGGEILLPVHIKPPGEAPYQTTVLSCSFDGRMLRYVRHGDEIGNDAAPPAASPTAARTVVGIRQRGFFEPSLTRFKGRFFLTLRNVDHGYVTAGRDGLHFERPRVWRFDDGEELGNYNTQQHWVTHSDGLFLVYTRRGAGNDHVFRHRAPLFIAQVDPERLCVLRATERILVPERGARLGNFGVTDPSPGETWVTVAEWMQAPGPNFFDSSIPARRGSDNSVFVARIRWRKPNRLVPER